MGGIYDFLRKKKIDSLQELEKSSPSSTPRQSSQPSSSKLDYAAQKAEAAALRKKQKLISDTEAEIARLEQEQADMEQLLSNPANQTTENFQKYETIKHQIEQKLYEWEILSE